MKVVLVGVVTWGVVRGSEGGVGWCGEGVKVVLVGVVTWGCGERE